LAGAAVGALLFACNANKTKLPPLEPWPTQLHMIAQVKVCQTTITHCFKNRVVVVNHMFCLFVCFPLPLSLSRQGVLGDRKPTAFIMGALGRSGKGAVDVLEALGFQCTKWDLAEVTNNPGPYPKIIEHDVFVNCVLLTGKVEPFVTSQMLSAPNCRLSVIVDVSCDTSNPHNPLPMCNVGTTLQNPVLVLNNHVSAIVIDHLPTLLPTESSEGFANDLVPHFLTLPDGDVWTRALALFQEKSRQ
jgi:hypothetical protein